MLTSKTMTKHNHKQRVRNRGPLTTPTIVLPLGVKAWRPRSRFCRASATPQSQVGREGVSGEPKIRIQMVYAKAVLRYAEFALELRTIPSRSCLAVPELTDQQLPRPARRRADQTRAAGWAQFSLSLYIYVYICIHTYVYI